MEMQPVGIVKLDQGNNIFFTLTQQLSSSTSYCLKVEKCGPKYCHAQGSYS